MKLGEIVEFDWNGRTARAWVPARLDDRQAPLTIPAVRASERALAALRRMEDVYEFAAEPIARLLLRSEGIASSAVEGLRVPIEQVLSVEAGAAATREPRWVAQNLAIVNAAIEEADRDLDVQTVHGWHRRLMAGSTLDDSMHGTWRNSPGWIGGSSPLDAAYVPPPADRIPALMRDLLAYVNSEADDPITQAAVAHAQFETIHPYGDGNGRLGRVLIGWVLRRRGAIRALPPPISVFIARDTGGYLSSLYQYREGDPGRWIEWFAQTTVRSADSAADLFTSVAELLAEWRSRVARLRADSAAHRVIDLLPHQPVVAAGLVADELGVSRRTALTALDELGKAGVLAPFEVRAAGSGRPARWWIASELVDLVRSWMG